MGKLQIKVLPKKVFNKKFSRYGLEGYRLGGVAKGNIIYLPEGYTKLDLEHEKAHHKLRHNKADLSIYQYANREIQAEQLARQKCNMKVSRYYLIGLYADIKSLVKNKRDNRYIRQEINRAARHCGIKARL